MKYGLNKERGRKYEATRYEKSGVFAERRYFGIGLLKIEEKIRRKSLRERRKRPASARSCDELPRRGSGADSDLAHHFTHEPFGVQGFLEPAVNSLRTCFQAE